jgi:predicted O-linked N-acetylglucosamine transferase (SPINDLY family)
MGIALQGNDNLDTAVESYKQAVAIKPDYAEAYYNLGTALNSIGDKKAAIENYRQALNIKPDYAKARAQKLHQQAQICDWDAIEEDLALIPKLGIHTQAVSPFSMLSLEDSPERHQIRSKKYANRSHFQPLPPLTYQPAKKPQPIRVGYFSADFHNHATMLLMIKVFELHNQKEFETHAYSFGPNRGDKMRQRVIKAVDIFHDVTHMSNQEIALFSQANNIDIAVDLKGFTKDNRMSIFAYRAAPIQISHLGYPGTMGADFIDYIIADKLVIPEKFESFYSERIIRLPYTYQPNDNTRVISETVVTRLEMGLPEQGFVFCCFNNSYKISSEEFNIWMRVLGKIEGSVLWLIKANKRAVKNLKKEAQSRGVASHRLIFADKAPQDQHLARHRLADLFIDTFNINAHTTASDALWAGLPLVTKLGQGFAARVAGSLLTAIGLPELIVESLEDYEALILDLANNPKRLIAIKEKLAANRLSKPLFDTELFTKHLEEGYQQAYQRHAQGKLPKNISVSAQLQTEA